jgi:hypothetical protein
MRSSPSPRAGSTGARTRTSEHHRQGCGNTPTVCRCRRGGRLYHGVPSGWQSELPSSCWRLPGPMRTAYRSRSRRRPPTGAATSTPNSSGASPSKRSPEAEGTGRDYRTVPSPPSVLSRGEPGAAKSVALWLLVAAVALPISCGRAIAAADAPTSSGPRALVAVRPDGDGLEPEPPSAAHRSAWRDRRRGPRRHRPQSPWPPSSGGPASSGPPGHPRMIRGHKPGLTGHRQSARCAGGGSGS